MGKSRQLTEKEVREKFLRYLIDIAIYWDKVEGKTSLEKINGAIFSTLAALDGESADLPAFIVAPYPNPTDKEYCKGNDENWYPENNDTKVICDIGGSLHDNFNRMRQNLENSK